MGKTNAVVPGGVTFEIFNPPSGNVRGFVVAFLEIKGIKKQVAHAYLMTEDSPPSISFKAPAKFDVAGLKALNETIASFVAKVEELSPKA